MVAEGSIPGLEKRPIDQVLAVRWDLGPALELADSMDAASLATIRALHRGPVYGLVRCDAACIARLRDVLPNGAERAHLEQRMLRTTEKERFDGIAFDASGFDEIDAAGSAFVEELAAATHAAERKMGVIVRITCRDVLCTGARLLGRIVRAVDLVILQELDQDIADEATRTDRRHRVFSETLSKGPTARIFLESENAIQEAKTLKLGGVYIGLVTSPSPSSPFPAAP